MNQAFQARHSRHSCDNHLPALAGESRVDGGGFGMRDRIPGTRIKMREDHVVPLSRQALAILAALKPLTGNHPWVFTSHLSFRKALGRAAIHNLFVRTGKVLKFAEPFTAHGVRSTFSTIANDAAVRPDVIERCLAHQERNATRRAYNRSTLLVERKELMQGWADMLDDFRKGKTEVSLVPRGPRAI